MSTSRKSIDLVSRNLDLVKDINPPQKPKAHETTNTKQKKEPKLKNKYSPSPRIPTSAEMSYPGNLSALNAPTRPFIGSPSTEGADYVSPAASFNELFKKINEMQEAYEELLKPYYIRNGELKKRHEKRLQPNITFASYQSTEPHFAYIKTQPRLGFFGARQNPHLTETKRVLNNAGMETNFDKCDTFNPHAIFTITHSEVLIHLMKEQQLSANDAFAKMKGLTEQELKTLLPVKAPYIAELD